MRGKVVLFTVALALLILLPALYFRFAPASTAPVQRDGQSADTPDSPAPAQAAASHPSWALSARRVDDVPPAEPEDNPAATHEEYVSEHVTILADLSTSNDPVSLKRILSELNNQDAAIRKAALEATVQFGGQDAIPTLRNQLNWTEDLHEKAAIQDAIDFLQLPSADSVMAQPAN
jgi:hypothetical protein